METSMTRQPRSRADDGLHLLRHHRRRHAAQLERTAADREPGRPAVAALISRADAPSAGCASV